MSMLCQKSNASKPKSALWVRHTRVCLWSSHFGRSWLRRDRPLHMDPSRQALTHGRSTNSSTEAINHNITANALTRVFLIVYPGLVVSTLVLGERVIQCMDCANDSIDLSHSPENMRAYGHASGTTLPWAMRVKLPHRLLALRFVNETLPQQQ